MTDMKRYHTEFETKCRSMTFSSVMDFFLNNSSNPFIINKVLLQSDRIFFPKLFFFTAAEPVYGSLRLFFGKIYSSENVTLFYHNGMR